jgi:hypothetical protein
MLFHLGAGDGTLQQEGRNRLKNKELQKRKTITTPRLYSI